eukprot:COSAG01_NODE_53136_length_341_cov_0.855372_1_plen_49_part_10
MTEIYRRVEIPIRIVNLMTRSRYLRSELHQRSLQRTEAVDAISSLTVSL